MSARDNAYVQELHSSSSVSMSVADFRFAIAVFAQNAGVEIQTIALSGLILDYITSLMWVDVQMEFEKYFPIEISETQAEGCRYVSDALELLNAVSLN